MAKSNYTTTIAIDTHHSAIHFYSMAGNDKSTIVHNIKNYTGVKLDDEFFAQFKDAVKQFVANSPSDYIRKITVILPDSAVLMDTVKIPTVKGSSQAQKMLDVTLGGIYRNLDDLHISVQVAEQNKQYTTIGVWAVQNKIVSAIYSACSENKLLVDTLTFASASAVGGAVQMNPKLKNSSYLLLDVKNGYSRFSFVVGGKVMGYYSLPFGIELLRHDEVVPEDVLFDHSYAELVLLNAREKAKSQDVTVMAFGENSAKPVSPAYPNGYELSNSAPGFGEFIYRNNGSVPGDATSDEQAQPRLFTKKSTRNLPRYMLRDIPTTQEGVAFENFRVFVKWALNLIQSNKRITDLDKPQFICVNLPAELSYVIDMINEEASENGITFTRLPSADDALAVSSNLELYGGLFPVQINSANKL